VSIDEKRLVELFRQTGDAWAPSADPDELARDLNRSLSRGRPPRGIVSVRAVRIAVTVCLLAAAVAVPLAMSGHGGPAAVPTSRGALPANFYGAGSNLAMSCSGSVCIVTGELLEHGRSVPAYVEVTNGVAGQPKVIPDNVTNGAQLNHISCSSPRDCVGASVVQVGLDGLQIEFARFNGAWHPLPQPPGLSRLVPSMGNRTDALHLTCVAAGPCVLVANGVDKPQPPLSFLLTGDRWTVLPPFPRSGNNYGYAISGLSCVNAENCYATGSLSAHVSSGRQCLVMIPRHGKRTIYIRRCDGPADTLRPVLVHWDGRNWQLVGLPPLPGPVSVSGAVSQQLLRETLESLGGISCVERGVCYVIDSIPGEPGVTQGVAVLRGGAWSRGVTAHWPPYLSSIDCAQAGNCLLAGGNGYSQLGRTQPVWALENGSWSRHRINLPWSNYLAVFGDLSCPEAARCYELYSTNTYNPYAAGTSYVLSLTRQSG
jgi:hypothetical protein